MRPSPATGADSNHDYLRTTCGRQLTIGRLSLGGHGHPAVRVFVDLGDCPGCSGVGWAGLTVEEARLLALAILAQAAAAERERGPSRPPL